MNKRFKLYNVNLKCIRNLHKIDDNVPSVSPQRGKATRPFLGIIVLINGSNFCIPFTSNSDKKNNKFESMRENITFRKICDKDGKRTIPDIYKWRTFWKKEDLLEFPCHGGRM